MSKPIYRQLNIEETLAPLILIIGQTGSGKSHFVNKVLGQDVEHVQESPRLTSCTKKPQLVPARVDGNEYLLVDTPGFNDTWRDFRRSDARILGEIAQTLTLQQQLGVKLRGILFCYDITVKRMTGDCLRQFELIKRICGKQNYSNVLLVTTNWPARYEDEVALNCSIRERDLRQDFWREMIAGGSSVVRFDDRHETAKAIVRRLASKPNITLALQDELVVGKGRLKRTRAFSFIVKTRQSDEAELTVAEGYGEQHPQHAEGIAIRKGSESGLHDDIVERVRQAIREQEEAERKQRRKVTIKSIFSWLIGIAHIAMGATQVGLAA